MYDKQAIWCQCVSVAHAIFAVAAMASIQSMSIEIDIFFGLLLIISTLVHFMTAEHAHIGSISAEKMQWAEMYVSRAAAVFAVVWQLPVESHLYLHLFSILLYLILLVFGFRWIWIVAALQCVYHFPKWLFFVGPLWAFSKMYYEKCFEKSRGQSYASIFLRCGYLYKSIFILMESVVIWHLRCMHRFPNTMRWRPVIMAILSIGMVCIYCTFNVLPTKVSRNAIIGNSKHQMAASLAAAEKCPQCKRNLSALDMESSFDNGF